MSAGGGGSGRSVLIVEDEPLIRELVAEHLRSEGYAVRVASHGAEGLALAREAPPDVILLDLMMPVMDGHDYLDALAREPGLVEVPVLLMTAAHKSDSAFGHSRVQGLIVKPFDLDVLVAAVEHVVDRARGPLAMWPPGPAVDGQLPASP
jgi:two-component system OmpR family response regulator